MLYMYFSWWRNIITLLLMCRKCRNDCIIIMFIICLDNDKLLELACTIWSIRIRYHNLIIIIIIVSIWFFECYNQIVSYSIIIECIIIEIIQLVNVIYLQHTPGAHNTNATSLCRPAESTTSSTHQSLPLTQEMLNSINPAHPPAWYQPWICRTIFIELPLCDSLPPYINQLSALGNAYHIMHSPSPGDFVLPQQIYRVLMSEKVKSPYMALWLMEPL